MVRTCRSTANGVVVDILNVTSRPEASPSLTVTYLWTMSSRTHASMEASHFLALEAALFEELRGPRVGLRRKVTGGASCAGAADGATGATAVGEHEGERGKTSEMRKPIEHSTVAGLTATSQQIKKRYAQKRGTGPRG